VITGPAAGSAEGAGFHMVPCPPGQRRASYGTWIVDRAHALDPRHAALPAVSQGIDVGAVDQVGLGLRWRSQVHGAAGDAVEGQAIECLPDARSTLFQDLTPKIARTESSSSTIHINRARSAPFLFSLRRRLVQCTPGMHSLGGASASSKARRPSLLTSRSRRTAEMAEKQVAEEH
jgi:hypothetical protein